MEGIRKGVGFGLFLLLVGIVWILVRVGIITTAIFGSLYVLWPLILVVIGVGIIFRRNPFVRFGLWVAFLAVLVLHSYYVVDKGVIGDSFASGSDVRIERHADTQAAELRIALGGTRINVDSNIGDKNNLLEASLQDEDIVHSADYGSSNASVVFDRKKVHFSVFDFRNRHMDTFHLNNEMAWKLDIDTGATDGDLDLTSVKLDSLTLDTGVANMKLRLGSSNARLEIKSGLSNVELVIPQDTGIKVNMDGGLNATNFDEAGWVKNGSSYYSPGYDSKTFKMEADVEMGLGNLSVKNSR